MEFSSLPIEVQKIAAECLSLKINERTSLVASVNSGPAKEQAQLVRDAFIALFSERELDGSKKEAAEELAATILVLQQLVTDDEIVKAQISHVVSAADNFVDKCL